MVTVADARDIARRWVQEEVAGQPGVVGAFVYGSAMSRDDDDVIPPTSDVDLKILIEEAQIALDPHKQPIDGVILDVSAASTDECCSAEALLGNYYTAIHFLRSNVVYDPTGHLSAIQPLVARDYALRPWVRKRVDHARKQTDEFVSWFDPTAPLHDQLYMWMLSFLGLTHMMLVADLDQPTIRKALANTGKILTRYGHADLHERLLKLFGSASLTRERAEELLAACADAFDAAVPIIKTPFFGSSNISAFALPITNGGGHDLIDSGAHRESLIWTALIHNWCHKALYNDADDALREAYAGPYAALLAEIGIATTDDIHARMARLQELIPEVHAVAHKIVDANPAARDA